MQNLTREQFLSRKNSDTIVVYGSGYSINEITEDQWNKLGKFDSIGFNWFLKSKRPVTFYLLREQDIWRANGTGDESKIELYDKLNKYYKNSCCIVVDLSKSDGKWARTNHYGKPAYREKISLDGVITKEIFARKNFEEYKKGFPSRGKRFGSLCRYFELYDLLDNGIVYDFCSIISILHIITFLKYKRIIFAGVDLYDHRYFWLGRNQLRGITRKKGRKLDTEHFVADFTCGIVGFYKEHFKNVDVNVLNPRSLLTKNIKNWSFDE